MTLLLYCLIGLMQTRTLSPAAMQTRRSLAVPTRIASFSVMPSGGQASFRP